MGKCANQNGRHHKNCEGVDKKRSINYIAEQFKHCLGTTRQCHHL